MDREKYPGPWGWGVEASSWLPQPLIKNSNLKTSDYIGWNQFTGINAEKQLMWSRPQPGLESEDKKLSILVTQGLKNCRVSHCYFLFWKSQVSHSPLVSVLYSAANIFYSNINSKHPYSGYQLELKAQYQWRCKCQLKGSLSRVQQKETSQQSK